MGELKNPRLIYVKGFLFLLLGIRGEIWMIDKAFDNPPSNAKFTLFASGLHEVLGIAQKDGWLYAQQIGELTKLKDTDGDGRADVFKTVEDPKCYGCRTFTYIFQAVSCSPKVDATVPKIDPPVTSRVS